MGSKSYPSWVVGGPKLEKPCLYATHVKKLFSNSKKSSQSGFQINQKAKQYNPKLFLLSGVELRVYPHS